MAEDLAHTPATPDRPSRQCDGRGIVHLIVPGQQKGRPWRDGDRRDRTGRRTGARGQIENAGVDSQPPVKAVAARQNQSGCPGFDQGTPTADRPGQGEISFHRADLYLGGVKVQIKTERVPAGRKIGHPAKQSQTVSDKIVALRVRCRFGREHDRGRGEMAPVVVGHKFSC